MDRSLDDVIADRERPRGPRRDGRNNNNNYPRDGVRKSTPKDIPRNLDRDWVHDRYEGDRDQQQRRPRDTPDLMLDRYAPADIRPYDTAAKIRVDNLHYDLTEIDLEELFARIGPIKTCQILYDRSDRSRGTAYVTYADPRDASRAVREYDGANAYGQPIKLTMVPSGAAAGGVRGGRLGAYDAMPARTTSSRSLFDRIDDAPAVRRPSRRSASPVGGRGARRSDVTRPPPENIDRYVPGERRRSRSPPPPRRGGRGSGRNGRREGGPQREREERSMVQGRPRKTAEQLDAEMDDYWGASEEAVAPEQNGGFGSTSNGNGNDGSGSANQHSATADDLITDDIDMIV